MDMSKSKSGKETAMDLHSEYIRGQRIDESFGKYRLSCKVGSYCVFGYDQQSNQRHHHDCYELCIVVSGKGSYVIEDYVLSIAEGDLLIAEPETTHEIRANSLENLMLLYIFITITENPRPVVGDSYGDRCIAGFLHHHDRITSQKHLLSYLQFIESYNATGRKNTYGTLEALRNLVLESLAGLSSGTNTLPQDPIKNIIESALDYIDANLHTRIRIREVAQSSCTTPRNLEYLFRKNLGKTVVGYINEKKTDLACHYLSMFFSVTDTAEMVGIRNASQFCTMFKKYRGISPTQFQRSALQDRNGMGRRI
jgi:AraC family transcriptional regulator, transcriptional activator of pobA